MIGLPAFHSLLIHYFAILIAATTILRNSPPLLILPVTMASPASAFLGSTRTHLRGLGLGAEVDRDELECGDAVRLVPEPWNPMDRDAVMALTTEDLLIGRVNKRHADAGQ